MMKLYEDILMKKILQTHVPDKCRIDSRPLLRLAEEIVHCITTKDGRKLSDSIGEVWPHKHKDLAHLIRLVSSEILRDKGRDRSSHITAMSVLELLGNQSWGAKVIIVLSALANCYAELWLVLKHSSTNPLALSVARLRGVNSLGTMESFECRFTALGYLFGRMVDVAKCIAEFEILPEQYIMLDFEAMAAVKPHIHMASYWVIRSSVTCACQITGMISLSSEKMYSILASAKWELWSWALKINDIHHCLQKQMGNFYEIADVAEKKIHSKLLHMFEEAHEDNQKILSTLFAIKNEHPFWDGSSQRKVGVTELRNKEVIFFISRPVIQLEQFLLIVQQLQNHPNNKPENLYEIVWIPIANCIPGSEVEEVSFNNIIDIWPWSSLYKPSLLSFSVLKFIREVWHFHDDPVMVVLDSKGRVISLNAIDMVVIWGDLAYPFSIIRERELWEGESWTFGFLLNGIDPLLSYWMEDGRTILLYGSHDIGWVREFTNKVKVIIEAGFSLELIYIGSNNLEQSKEVLATVTTERLSRIVKYGILCFGRILPLFRSIRGL